MAVPTTSGYVTKPQGRQIRYQPYWSLSKERSPEHRGMLVIPDTPTLRYGLRLNAVVDRHRRVTDIRRAFLETVGVSLSAAATDHR